MTWQNKGPCANCGFQNLNTASFCGGCGSRLASLRFPLTFLGIVVMVLTCLFLVTATAGVVYLLPESWELLAIGRPEPPGLPAVAPVAEDLPTMTATLPAAIADATTPPSPDEAVTIAIAASPTIPPTRTPTSTLPPTAIPTATPTPAPTLTPTTLPTATPITASDVVAHRLSSPPIIDGLLAEWKGRPAYLSAFRVYTAPDWNGEESLTAVWYLAWDADNLYLAVDVTDDVHVQTQTGNQVFRGDSVEIQVDTNYTARATGLNPAVYQLLFSPGDFQTLPPSAVRLRGNEIGQIRDAPGHNIIVAARQTASGYTLEAAVPWSDLSLIPRERLVLGFALNANDNDTLGTARQEVMMSNVPTRLLTNPSSWGTLTLR